MEQKKEAEMSFLEHLEVMRWHLLRSLLSIVILALVAFVFKEIVFDKIILAPKEPGFPDQQVAYASLEKFWELKRICINQDPFTLQTVKMAEQFSMHIIVSLVAGSWWLSPTYSGNSGDLLYLLCMIRRKEQPAVQSFIPPCFLFSVFCSGIISSAPLSVNFLGNYKVSESVISAPTLRSYVQTITSVVLAAGLVFQLPILVYFLSKVGLVTPDFLKKYRRHSIILIVTLSAIITPPDVFSQVLVALPLMILYEIGISISRRIMKQQEAEYEEKGKSKKGESRKKGLQERTKELL